MDFIDEQKYKNNIGIYKIENLINGKVYIGQTKEKFQRRYWLHRWQLRNNSHDNTHLQRAWNKYGEENFSFEIIEILTEDKLNEREKYWIKYYRNSVGCYCIQDGGQPNNLNNIISPEIRKRIGELNRKRMLGSKLSEETKQKMSKSRKGKPQKKKTDILTLDQAKEIKQRLVNGEKAPQIAKDLHVPYNAVANILSNNSFGTTVYVEGWENFQKNRIKRKRMTKEKIQQIYDLYDKYHNYSKVAKILEISKETVKYHILKRNKQ